MFSYHKLRISAVHVYFSRPSLNCKGTEADLHMATPAHVICILALLQL